MDENRSTIRAVGALIGIVLFILVIRYAVGFFQETQSELAEFGTATLSEVQMEEAEAVSETEAAEEGEQAEEATEDDSAGAAEEGDAEAAPAEETSEQAAEEVTAEEVPEEAAAEAPAEGDADAAAEEAPAEGDVDAAAEEAPAEGDVDAAAEEAPAEGDADAAAEEAPAEGDAAAADETVAAIAAHEAMAPSEVVAVFNKSGCAGCHVIPGIPGANGQVGPDLTEIGVDGASRIDGYSADEYIRESILDPNAFIAPECPFGDCPANVMLPTFGQTLSEEELDTVVDYLSKLGTEEQVALSEEAAAPMEMEYDLPPESVLEPFAPLPKDAAGAAQIALGKYLFFDSRLSGNNSLSCASCHQPDNAFTDGQALSAGYPSTSYFRNTPTVLNTVFADRLYRDGRMDGRDMPTLVRDHIAEAHFMSMDGRLMVERLNQIPEYVDLFNEAFGSGPGYGRVLNAISAYVQSLNSPPTAYDLYVEGDSEALSDDAVAGLELFEGKAGCSECHGGALFSDGQYYNTGVGTDIAMFDDPERHLTFRRFFRVLGVPNYRQLSEDVGQYALTIDQEDWGKFVTPSLREVERTPPYMHDGSLATLEDVVAFYNDGGGETQTAGLESLSLSDEEAAQLVAFLATLSSEPIPVEAPMLPDYALVELGGTAD